MTGVQTCALPISEEVRAAELLGEREREGERDDVDNHHGDDGKQRGVPEGVLKHGVLDGLDIVFHTHKMGVRHGRKVAERQADAHDKRDHEADEERQERRQDKDRKLALDGFFHDQSSFFVESIRRFLKKATGGRIPARHPEQASCHAIGVT